MGQIPSLLNRLEARLQKFIEGGLGRVFPAYDLRQTLLRHLIQAMQTEIRLESPAAANLPAVPAEENLVAPDQFTIFAPADQIAGIKNQQDLLKELARELQQAAQMEHVRFLNPPTVRLIPTPDQGAGRIEVVAQFSLLDISQTSTLHQEPSVQRAASHPAALPALPSAFLIVDGVRTFRVEEALVNIGRQEDNHLLINDPRVSRHHAQLRFTLNRFVLFDLGSTGGTQVNGEQITQRILVSGDVITLGGIPIIFGSDPNTPASSTQTTQTPKG